MGYDFDFQIKKLSGVRKFNPYDFIITNPDPNIPISHHILDRLCKSRLKSNFQTFIFITGGGKIPTGTGQGKSYFALKWVEILMEFDGLKLIDYLDDIVVYTPLEYAEKMKALIENPRLRDVHYIIIDEATEILDAGDWQNFLNKAIRAINVKSRAVKNLVVFIIAPNPMDLEKPTRRMLTFYCECARPLSGPTRVKIYRPILISRGLDDFSLDKAEIYGKIKTDKKTYTIFPKFTISMPSKEVRDKYDKLQRERKTAIVMRDLNELIKQLKSKYGEALKRVETLADYFISKPAIQSLFLKFYKKRNSNEMGIKVNEEFIKNFNLSKEEQENFLAIFRQKFMLQQNKKFENIINSDKNNLNKENSEQNNETTTETTNTTKQEVD